jgi:hypothetical protein
MIREEVRTVPEAMYQPPDGYKTMAQAAQQIGVSLVTLRKLVQRRQVEIFQDARDARAKLLRNEDVDQLAQPIPLGPAKKEAA